MRGFEKLNEKKDNVKIDLDLSQKKFKEIVKLSLLIGIAVLSGLIIYFTLNPEPGYIGFGILNEDKEAGNYPKTVKLDENIHFYVTVGNFLNEEFTFRIKVYRGDNETVLKPTGSKKAELNFTTSKKTLESGETWISKKLSISFSEIGSKQILIAELWEITEDNDEEFWDIMWIRLNITA